MNPNPYSLIAKLKAADIYLQIACFLFMVITFLAEMHVFGHAVAAMALEQCLSTLCWMFFLRKEERMFGGSVIRNIFLAVMIILVLAACIKPEFMLGILIAMVVIGPILGLFYFGIAVAELDFYKRLQAQAHNQSKKKL